MGREASLNRIRDKIRRLTGEIIELSWERMKLVDEVVKVKKKLNLPIEDLNVERKLKDYISNLCIEKRIDLDYASKILNLLLEEAKKRQRKLYGENGGG